MSKADDFFDFAQNELADEFSILDDILESLAEEAQGEYDLGEIEARRLVGEALLYEAKDKAFRLRYDCRVVEEKAAKPRSAGGSASRRHTVGGCTPTWHRSHRRGRRG
jgi:hypothetical protein